MYIVMEVQVFADGGMSTPCYSYDNSNSAEAKYHAILSSAAVSALPRHTAFLLMDNGRVLKSESYEHPIEPTPDPESEVEE